MSRQFAEVIFWIVAGVCAVAQLAILRLVFRRPQHTETLAVAAVPRPPRALEILWAVIPALGLFMMLAATWRAIH